MTLKPATSEFAQGARPSDDMERLGQAAREAAALLARSSEEQRNQALRAGAANLRAAEAEILAANTKDMKSAEARGLSAALLDRLLLDPKRLEAMAQGLEAIAELRDPLHHVLAEREQPGCLRLHRVAHPVRVVGILYDSPRHVPPAAAVRRHVCAQAAHLRGGAETVAPTGPVLAGLRRGREDAGPALGCL